MSESEPLNALVAAMKELYPYSSEEEMLHSAAIWRVAGNWAMSEFTFDLCVCQILEFDDKKAACLFAQIVGPQRKLEAYASAVKLVGLSKSLTKREKFITCIKGLGERRNRIVHDSWMITNELGPSRYQITARGLLVSGLVQTPTLDVIKLGGKITEYYFTKRT